LGEQVVITQIAFEVKTRQMDGVAEEFIGKLLATASDATREEKDHAYAWMCQEASIVPIGQGVLRQMLKQILARLRNTRVGPLAYLVSARGENRRLIDREIQGFLESQMTKPSSDRIDFVLIQEIISLFRPQRFDDELLEWVRIDRKLAKILTTNG
jgi:hypothetical protein